MPLVIEPNLTQAGLIVLTLAMGIFLYRLRCTHRFLYGIIEIVASLLVMYVTWVPQRSFQLLNQGTSLLGNYIITGIGVLTGVYILVRGLDNIDTDLPVGWRFPWDRVFRARWWCRREQGCAPRE
jgi:hypothetical protein